jgi:protein-tyrosine phosphatase
MPTQSNDLQRQRVFVLEGGCNFRDIGGYATTDGRTVRWGHVFRGGVLSYFTDKDHQHLLSLGVRTICDLRRTEERHQEPTRWPGDPVEPLYFDDGLAAPSEREFEQAVPTVEGMRQAMIASYRTFPVWMQSRLRGLFATLGEGRTPLVIHCSAGKDRTGVAIAVLLSALGVPREVVVEDYLLTNHAGDFEAFVTARHESQLGVGSKANPLLSLPRNVRAQLFLADAEFIQAAFDRIDQEFGGMDAYLSRTLGVDDATLTRIKDLLLV